MDKERKKWRAITDVTIFLSKQNFFLIVAIVKTLTQNTR